MDPEGSTGSRTRGLWRKCVFPIAALAVILATPPTIRAESLSTAQQEALQREAIPTYPDARFTTFDDGEELLVLWFRSSDPPAKIMDWYGQQLSSWSRLETNNGTTVLYKGPPGLEATQLSGKPYIFTRLTTESEPVDSEITVRLPKN